MDSLFSPDELVFYRRQIVLEEVGGAGQAALKSARVLVVGAGGLGSPVLLYLAAAGIGQLDIVEFDTIERSNLHRQILYGFDVVGQSKALTAASRLRAAFPFVDITVHEKRLSVTNVDDLVSACDVVVDCSDNLSTRYLVNDACVRHGKPDVSASILRFDGQLSVFAAQGGPCYRCLFPEEAPASLAPSCAEAGVLGVLPGILGSMQAAEAIKLILGAGTPLIGRLLVLDALEMRTTELEIVPDPQCRSCSGRHPTAAVARGTPVAHMPVPELDPTSLQEMLSRFPGCILLDVRTPTEHDLVHIHPDRLIPLADLEDRMHELATDAAIICYCHLGGRSLRGAALLMQNGFTNVASLRGGVDAWSAQIDSSLPRY